MTRPTTAPPPQERPAASASPRRSLARELAAPVAAGALLAWIELAGGLVLGPPHSLGRAEALFFLVCRPWVIIVAAISVAHWSAPRRAALYAATLAVAASGETVLVFLLGAVDPWPEMLRGLALGILAAVAADFIVQKLRHWRKWLGRPVALVLLGGLLVLASGTRPYEALVIGPTAPREGAGPKPRLLLMTSLPIVWGAGGAFDANSRPAESYRALEREFQVTPIDAVQPETLRGHRLMLLAQPRVLAPEELVAIDSWVRAGGNVLILTDPVLVAAREFPPMDIRRPPAIGLLGPLLDHWGLRVEPGNRLQDLHIFDRPGGPRRLLVDRPGRFAVSGKSCRMERSLLVRCRIGRGAALLVADADLLTDAVWAPAGPPRGHERHLRIADNPLIVADWLDQLAGVQRERSDRSVAWLQPGMPRFEALLRSLLPGILALLCGLVLLLVGGALAKQRRTPPTTLSTVLPTENSNRTEHADDP